jgi:hypothetical protein
MQIKSSLPFLRIRCYQKLIHERMRKKAVIKQKKWRQKKEAEGHLSTEPSNRCPYRERIKKIEGRKF